MYMDDLKLEPQPVSLNYHYRSNYSRFFWEYLLCCQS